MMHRCKWLLTLCAVGAIALIAAPTAAASVPGYYIITMQSGKTFHVISGQNHNLISSAADDTLTTLSRSASGAAHLPFRLPAYGRTYASVQVSSNGDLTFGAAGGSTAFGNEALPTADFTAPTMMPFWDDLYLDPADMSLPFHQGIFTKTTGEAPHRVFTISWQGRAFSNAAYAVLAQVIFHQGSQNVQYRYGAPDNQGASAPSETIGIQLGGPSHFRQIAFDPPPPGAVQAGTQFTLTHH
jgi:hypothetical protein